MCYLQREQQIQDSPVPVIIAGASLIAPGIVLTAAHWVVDLNKNELRVICGDWDIKQQIETRKFQKRNVRDKTIHPAFNPKNLFNDFAILHMETDFELQPHVNVICLPTSQDFEEFDKDHCVAKGWGKDQEGNFLFFQINK